MAFLLKNTASFAKCRQKHWVLRRTPLFLTQDIAILAKFDRYICHYSQKIGENRRNW
jgi:hypothetical protein